MDEINKLGDIHNVGDILDFKLSIKTIAIIIFLWCGFCSIVVIILFGGIDNTTKYFTGLLSSAKKSIIDNKKNRDTIKHRKGKNTSEDEKKGSDDE